MLMIGSLAACTPKADVADATEAPQATAAPATEVPATEAPKDDEPEEPAGPTYQQSPMLDSMGLPPIEERLPQNPKVFDGLPPDLLDYQIGQYGGTIRTVSQAPDYSPNVFIMNNEGLLFTPGILGKEVTPNVLASYTISDDNKVYTFEMRKGMKWSDGEPVTTDDVLFAVNDFILDPVLNPGGVPEWLRSAGKVDGTPFVLDVIDDFTFTMTFDEAYAGFPIRMGIEGWRGYTDLLKPAHHLKKIHYKYIDEEALAAAMKEYNIDAADDNARANLFAIVDVLNTQLCSPRAKGFPVLYPWTITDVKPDGSLVTFTRNPYYHKVDTAGNQLPYIDYVTIEVVQDMEMITMKIISGEVDFAYGLFTSLSNMPMYRENAERGGFTAMVAPFHNLMVNPILNFTNEDENWRAVVRDERFRRGLYHTINAQEYIDAIYYGQGTPVNETELHYDPEKAKSLFDDMGLTVGSDGFRIGPDGKTFLLPYETDPYGPEVIQGMELLTMQMQDCGINATLKTIDGNLKSTRRSANEMFGDCYAVPTPLWYYRDIGQPFWGPLWNQWWQTSGENGEEPPQEVKDIYQKLTDLAVLRTEAAEQTFQQLKRDARLTGYLLQPCETTGQAVIAHKDLKNISDKSLSIAIAYAFECVWYSQD